MKYRIVFDTNSVFCDEENQLDKVFNSNIKEVFDFLKLHRITTVSLCLPRLVFDERIAQRLRQIDKQFEVLNSTSRNLKIFGIILLKEKIFDIKKIQKKLNKNAIRQIKESGIEIIPTAKIDQEIIIKRALQKIAPFYGGQKKSDQGFKDTLIWLSLLKDADKNYDCNYILITDDKTGFDQERLEKEFKEHSLAKFWVVKNLSDLQKFLDKELNLDLKLEKLFNDIKQEILSLQGTITAEVGRYLNTHNYGLMFSPTSSRFYNSITGQEDERGNFDFYHLDISNISPKNDNEFNIQADLYVKLQRAKADIAPWSFKSDYGYDYFTQVYPSHEDNAVKYNVNLKYKRDSKDIEVLSAVMD